MADTKTLDEHAARVALEARLTRERDEAIAKRDATAAVLMRQAERAEAAEARVRELEAERDALVKAHAIRERVFNACAKAELQQRTIDLPAWRTRADKAEADLAETRAQLARLREAGSAALQDIYEGRHTCPVCDGGDTDDGCAHETDCGLGALEAALSTPGPTLAEIRREAQVEALRELAKEMAPPAAPTMGSATWDAWRERIARQFGTFDAVAIHDWLRQRADDLEAGRE